MSHPPFVAHDPKHIDPQKDHPRRAVLTAVPDLRFEYGFLKSVRPFFRLRPTATTVPESPGLREGAKGTGKGKEKAQAREREAATEVLEIQWLDVGWVTVRDQVLSPLVQGALWAIAAHLLSPFYPQARSFIPSPPEGGIAKWLRGWAKSFKVSSASTSRVPLYTRP